MPVVSGSPKVSARGSKLLGLEGGSMMLEKGQPPLTSRRKPKDLGSEIARSYLQSVLPKHFMRLGSHPNQENPWGQHIS